VNSAFGLKPKRFSRCRLAQRYFLSLQICGVRKT